MYYRMAECRYGGTWVSENAKKEYMCGILAAACEEYQKKT